jgi:hypothetical protein
VNLRSLLLAVLCAACVALPQVHASAADEPSAASEQPSTIGHIDQPAAGVITDPEMVVSGWTLSKSGTRRVEIIVDGRERIEADIGVARPDVEGSLPGFPGNDKAGFDAKVALGHLPMGRHEIEIVVVDMDGVATVLGRRVYVNQSFRNLWADLLAARGHRPDEVFHFVFATSRLADGGGAEIDTEYAPFLSDTMKVGVRVPILYMRTTKGPANDYSFDPDFDTSRTCGTRRIAEDSLNGVLKWSIEHQLPVLFTLNGGIWGDAACDVPDWDVNDFLEQNPLNCQWNEHDEVMPDDFLRHLPGSQDAPELARALTLNVYAEKVRHYKKRNLQQAAATIQSFAAAHPHLFIGVSLDPDVYMNPFFDGKQWYDYNPGTLRQFREWLQGKGPYAGQPRGAAPDLSKYRIANPYTLETVNRIAPRRARSWSDVDPPREFKPAETMLKTPWAAVWERFRRHVVDLHYDELSQWVADSGIDSSRIFSSQGFNAPGKMIEPFPVRIDSPPKNYDTGGMSVQGALPARGHLGAILYGESAINNIRMEAKDSLFRVFRDFDRGWAVVEYNTADVRTPQILPDASRGYAGLRDILNFGAVLVSPMAWNGSPGPEAGKPGFVAYTSYRGAPLETAARNLMVHRANLPRQARLWGFGLGTVRDNDGWTALLPAVTETTGSGLKLTWKRGRARLDSPSALDFRTSELDLIVLAMRDAPPDLRISVQGRDRGGEVWRRLTDPLRVAELQHARAGTLVPLPHSRRQVEQLRLILQSERGGALTIERIALYPVGKTGTDHVSPETGDRPRR